MAKLSSKARAKLPGSTFAGPEQIEERTRIVQNMIDAMPGEGNWKSLVDIAASFVCTLMTSIFNEENFPDKKQLFLAKVNCIYRFSEVIGRTAFEIDVENDINAAETMAIISAEKAQRGRPH